MALKGKTAGETLDEATITAAVKMNPAEESATLTRVGVTTNLGTIGDLFVSASVRIVELLRMPARGHRLAPLPLSGKRSATCTGVLLRDW
jgi:hypothetical protein